MSIDVDPTGKWILTGLVGDTARMLSLTSDQVQRYSNWDVENRIDNGFGAMFVAHGQGVLFGCVQGCALVWDTKNGNLIYGLEHHEGRRKDVFYVAVGN